MVEKSLTERVQDAAADLIAAAVGGTAGYYAGRRIDPAGGGSTVGAAVGSVVASTAAKDLVKDALERLRSRSNPSDEDIHDMLQNLYTSQASLKQLVQSAREASSRG